MKRGSSLDASALFDSSVAALQKAGALKKLRGSLVGTRARHLLGTYADPARLAEHNLHVTTAGSAASKYSQLLHCVAAHVDDPFQRAELGRLGAHVKSIELLAVRERRILASMQAKGQGTRDHMREIAALLEDQRMHHDALRNAVEAVAATAAVEGTEYTHVSSRIVVALVAKVLGAAAHVEHDNIHLVPFDELTPSMVRLSTQRVENVENLLLSFAKGF